MNLLPPQHKRRGVEGDVGEMLHARRRFLDAGYYLPLLDALTTRVRGIIESSAGTSVVAEVGCGEGYYIGNIAASVGPAAAFLGTDLSKPAVKLAARRYPDVLFFVSDVHRRLYVPDATLDVLLDVFAPRNAAEFARVLRPDAAALVVLPSEKHLASARAELGLLEIEAQKERRVLESLAEDFTVVDRQQIEYALELPASAVADLVGMGPNYWHGERTRAFEGESLRTNASFVVLHLERNLDRARQPTGTTEPD